jgi:hypothetical protein
MPNITVTADESAYNNAGITAASRSILRQNRCLSVKIGPKMPRLEGFKRPQTIANHLFFNMLLDFKTFTPSPPPSQSQ